MENKEVKVSADIIVERSSKGKPQVLLIKRKNSPYQGKWALPGGFVEQGEEVATAAQRELREETGVDLKREQLQFLDYFDAPDRDPRGRIISFAFGINLKNGVEAKAASDAAEARWFALDELPELAFDHRSMLARWEERK